MRQVYLFIWISCFGLPLPSGARDIKFVPELTEAMRHAVMIDWQTDSAWLPEDPKARRPSNPSDEFVKKVVEKCTFEAVDLNGDGQDEIIVNNFYAPGATGNATCHIFQKQARGWTPIGFLGGRQVQVVPVTNGFAILRSSWKINLGTYLETVCVWRQGKYREARSEESNPENTRSEPVKVSTNGLGTTLTPGEVESMEHFALDQADAYLNGVYNRLVERLDAEGRQKLRAPQRSWLSFRDAEAESVANAHRNDGLGRAYKTVSLAKTTGTRASELDAQLEKLSVRRP